MGQITLNYQDAKRILDNLDANSDARVIAASTLAFFELRNNADAATADTRAIALKLLHMASGACFGETP